MKKAGIVMLIFLCSIMARMAQAETYVGGDITTDTTWTLTGSPYIVQSDFGIGNPSTPATLTIEAGVEVRFQTGTAIYVGASFPAGTGGLSAQGTSENPIVFTSDAVSPAQGDWDGIYFTSYTDDALSSLNHTVVEYGGLSSYNANIVIHTANPSVSNTISRHSSGVGIYIKESASTLSNCTAISNGNHGFQIVNSSPSIIDSRAEMNGGHGVIYTSSSGSINNSTIQANGGSGIFLDSGAPKIVNNIISNHTGSAIYASNNQARPEVTGNTISDNGPIPLRLYTMKGGGGNTIAGAAEAIELLGGNIQEDEYWPNYNIPYRVLSTITIGRPSNTTDPAVLTVSPGVEIRFQEAAGFMVGASFPQSSGSLVAQGIEDMPITFTSDAISPAPGDWAGIHFNPYTDDATAFLENAIIEYGGHTYGCNVCISAAAPTIQYNTIRNSSQDGLYISSTGSNNTIVNCNNFTDNVHGIRVTTSPVISNNNFLRNSVYGIYKTGSGWVNAENNWWNDAAGPNMAGDATSNNTNTTPWLTSESTCVQSPPTNHPPISAHTPSPADESTHIQPVAGAIDLQWSGGDLNVWDTVRYDIYLGASTESMALAATDLTSASYSFTTPTEGQTYHWQIVSRDDIGAETAGPIWSFTTEGSSPDLTVSALSWQPATDIEHGQTVTLSADLSNIGTGPVADPFEVDFLIDGISVGSQSIADVLLPSGSLQVNQSWSAVKGSHTLEVVVDAGLAIVEELETNNSLFQSLPPIVDLTPPAEAHTLNAFSEVDSLLFTWHHSPNRDGDLAGYRVYFNNDPQGVDLPSSQNSYQESGLAFATAYDFRVSSFDDTGNESAGATTTGVTPLPNPTGVTVEPSHEKIKISWDPAEPSQYVAGYKLYMSQTDFFSVEGMSYLMYTPKANTFHTFTGLQNNTTYFLAVTTNNISYGETKAVTTISATPAADSAGPTITSVTLDGATLNHGSTMTESGTFMVTATDPEAVGRIEFLLDNILRHTDISGATASWYLDSSAESDGNHTFEIAAYDTLENVTLQSYVLNLSLAPPGQAPVISAPAGGATVNTNQIEVQGQACQECEVGFYLNGLANGSPTPVDSSGSFSATIALTEGANTITASSRNRAGEGPQCAAVTVILDSSLPQPPTGLAAQAAEGGEILLSWTGSLSSDIQGYHIYRAESDFTDPAMATKLTTSPVSGSSYTDLPAADATYFYRVMAEDQAGNLSTLSNQVSALADSIPPVASLITYQPYGPYDTASGRTGPGMVDVSLTVSEPLLTTPFLTMTPNGGMPITISLIKESDTAYTGLFQIENTTPSGAAHAVFSSRDLAGNRGTTITTGTTMLMDTAGPQVIGLSIDPPSPILNDQASPVTITATLTMDEEVDPAAPPELSYLLSGPSRQETVIASVQKVAAWNGTSEVWQATFSLDADAGLFEPETLTFLYRGLDDLGNIATTIQASTSFQVYQGTLPPLEPPSGLVGASLPNGQIQLSWNSVEGAADYMLYRQGPAESELAPYLRLGDVLERIDHSLEEGSYTYALTSIRAENGQESESALSTTVTVLSDATPPEPPSGLSLELSGQGIQATWQPSPSLPVTYNLYRADTLEITSVAGLTPTLADIAASPALDSQPSSSHHAYTVTAVDEAGNESAPASSVYLNFDLLPVASLTVSQTDSDLPVLAWASDSPVAGYLLELETDDGPLPLHQGLLTTSGFTDQGYNGGSRTYTVTCQDDLGVKSLGRTISLPELTVTLTSGLPVHRNLMNRLTYTIENHSSIALASVRLLLDLAGHVHQSESFTLPAGESIEVSAMVGGFSDLPGLADLQTTVEITPNEGEMVEVVRSQSVEVVTGMLTATVQHGELLREVTAPVSFSLENTGQESIELVTARDTGASPSDEITIYLLDQDDNVLTVQPFSQYLGTDVITLSSGVTVARIEAGATFSSAPVDLEVPATAPDQAVILLEIGQIHSGYSTAEQVSIQGLSSRAQVTLSDTAYYGQVNSVAPAASQGEEPIVISGQAVQRQSGQAMANVPLVLVVSKDGFERSYDLFTGRMDFSASVSHPTAAKPASFQCVPCILMFRTPRSRLPL